jgi:hypothetical protein
MITRRRIHDLGRGEHAVLEGNPLDELPEDNTIMLSPDTGQVYGPGTALSALPHEVLQLPKTHWYEGPFGPAREPR